MSDSNASSALYTDAGDRGNAVVVTDVEEDEESGGSCAGYFSDNSEILGATAATTAEATNTSSPATNFANNASSIASSRSQSSIPSTPLSRSVSLSSIPPLGAGVDAHHRPVGLRRHRQRPRHRRSRCFVKPRGRVRESRAFLAEVNRIAASSTSVALLPSYGIDHNSTADTTPVNWPSTNELVTVTMVDMPISVTQDESEQFVDRLSVFVSRDRFGLETYWFPARKIARLLGIVDVTRCLRVRVTSDRVGSLRQLGDLYALYSVARDDTATPVDRELFSPSPSSSSSSFTPPPPSSSSSSQHLGLSPHFLLSSSSSSTSTAHSCPQETYTDEPGLYALLYGRRLHRDRELQLQQNVRDFLAERRRVVVGLISQMFDRHHRSIIYRDEGNLNT